MREVVYLSLINIILSTVIRKHRTKICPDEKMSWDPGSKICRKVAQQSFEQLYKKYWSLNPTPSWAQDKNFQKKIYQRTKICLGLVENLSLSAICHIKSVTHIPRYLPTYLVWNEIENISS